MAAREKEVYVLVDFLGIQLTLPSFSAMEVLLSLEIGCCDIAV
jgi:hypothetical protein